MSSQLISDFYSAFAKRDSDAMIACYHDDIVFEDPAFGRLEGDRAKAMWQMLLNSPTKLKIDHSCVQSAENRGSAEWVAKYNYGPNMRPVINRVSATFEFEDGKIIKHIDQFDLWSWSKQALGISGVLLGWSSFMRRKIQKTTRNQLTKFMNQSASSEG